MVPRSPTRRLAVPAVLALSLAVGTVACSSDDTTPAPADSVEPDGTTPDATSPDATTPDAVSDTGDTVPPSGGINGPAQVDPDFGGLGDSDE